MARKPKPSISEGDLVILKGRVTRVDDSGEHITVHVNGYDYAVTLGIEWVEKVPAK